MLYILKLIFTKELVRVKFTPPLDFFDNPAESGKPMNKTCRLLIIDDNEELLFALRSFFESKGYKVATAPNGLEGLKLLENEPQKFDLLITDLIMPYVSGVGIITIVKKKYPDFPIVAMTGWGDFPEALAAEAKADYVFKKPFQLTELEKRVKKLLGTAK